jgi:hypothetical protein
MSKYYKPNNATIMYLNSSYNCIKNSSITLTKTSGGTGYTSAPTIVITPATNDAGTGASATITQSGGVLGTLTITNNGNNYNTLPNITLTGGGLPGVITSYTGLVGGSGYITPPLVSAIGGGGSGFSATAVLTGNAVSSIIITNGGSNYSTTPTIVFTPTSGGSGASATPTINLGTAGVITPSFLRTYTYTWNGIPPLVINDLARLSAINIIATGFTASTPYTYRILGLQYDSRDSFFSDYGNPILSIAQNVNICSYGSLGGGQFCIILTPQTINSITISVDDDISKIGSGQLASINFVIAIEIEEYDPITTEIGDPYSESVSRLKHHF